MSTVDSHIQERDHLFLGSLNALPNVRTVEQMTAKLSALVSCLFHHIFLFSLNFSLWKELQLETATVKKEKSY